MGAAIVFGEQHAPGYAVPTRMLIYLHRERASTRRKMGRTRDRASHGGGITGLRHGGSDERTRRPAPLARVCVWYWFRPNGAPKCWAIILFGGREHGPSTKRSAIGAARVFAATFEAADARKKGDTKRPCTGRHGIGTSLTPAAQELRTTGWLQSTAPQLQI
jgi:hypothetical protein